jgi:hypothetical protein
MNWNSCCSALEQAVKNLNLGYDLAFENMAYDTKPGTPFIRVVFTHVNSEKITMGTHGIIETLGIMTLGLNFPAGAGGGLTTSTADTIADTFLPGTAFLIAPNEYAICDRFSFGHNEPSSDPAWWVLPLSVYFHAYHNT